MKLAAAATGVVNLLMLVPVWFAISVGGRALLVFVAVLLNIAVSVTVVSSLRSTAVRIGAASVGLVDIVLVIEAIKSMSSVKYPNPIAAAIWCTYGLLNVGVCAWLVRSTLHMPSSSL